MTQKLNNEQINMNDYYIQPNSFLIIKEIGDSFYEYLKKELNQEPLEFLWMTKNFKKGKSEDDLSLFLKIYNIFINPESEKQINLSGKTLKDIQKFIKEVESTKMIDETPFDVLSGAIQSISMDLMYDSFPRFVRSDEGQKLILANILNPSVAILNNSYLFPYYIEDFMIPFCQEKDALFLKSLLQDSFEWELLYSQKSKINSYLCKRNYFPNIKNYNFSIHKTDIIIDYPLEFIILAIVPESSFQKWDKTLIDYTTILTISPQEIKEKYKDHKYEKFYNSRVTQLLFNFGFPMSTLRLVSHTPSITIIDKDNILIFSKPFLDETILDVKKINDKFYYKNQNVIIMPTMSAYLYTRISPTKTRISQVHCVDLLGWSSLKYFEKMVVKHRCELLLKNLESYLSTLDQQSLKFKHQKENLKNGKFGELGKIIYHEINWEELESKEKKRRGAILSKQIDIYDTIK